MTCKISRFLLGILMLMPATLASGQYSTNSVYSIFGIGDLVPNSFAKQSGMGRAGVALASDGFINIQNPASLTAFDSTSVLMDIGFTAERNRINSGVNDDDDLVKTFDGNLDHFALAFPVAKWWGATVGIKRFSEIGYSIGTSTVFEGLDYEVGTEFTGSGGISQAFFNNSFRLGKNLSLGFSFSYLMGNLDQTEITELSDLGFNDVYTTNSYYLNNIYWSFGMLYNIHLGGNMLSLGLTYAPSQNLLASYDHEVTLETSDDSQVLTDEDTKSYHSYTIPGSLSAGLAFNFNSKLKLVADYEIQEWSDNSTFIRASNLTDRSAYHVGLEYSPNAGNYASYLEKVQYRIGGYMENSYILVKDNQIKDYGITFGLGLPFQNEKSRMNLAVELGTLGTLSDGLIREYYAGFSLDFILHSNWFQKRKYL